VRLKAKLLGQRWESVGLELLVEMVLNSNLVSWRLKSVSLVLASRIAAPASSWLATELASCSISKLASWPESVSSDLAVAVAVAVVLGLKSTRKHAPAPEDL
jgi:hypothetical protein